MECMEKESKLKELETEKDIEALVKDKKRLDELLALKDREILSL